MGILKYYDGTAWQKVDLAIPANPFLDAHPVGSIYLSVDSANPGIAHGGTWVAWGAGRVPVGVDTSQTEFDTVEETGGEKTHILTTAEMPPHNHTLHRPPWRTAERAGTGQTWAPTGTTYNWITNTTTGEGGIDNTGGGSAHNNLQPYITCYMWKRTA